MENYFGKNGFIWFVGVVEDRMDPEKLGRVRVRCLGHHSPDKIDIPTNHLSWSTVMAPTTNPSMNGLGSTPPFLVEGSWVTGFFVDQFKQECIIVGSLPGFNFPSEDSDNKDGFKDPNGVYPRSGTDPEDTNKLARGSRALTHNSLITRKNNKMQRYGYTPHKNVFIDELVSEGSEFSRCQSTCESESPPSSAMSGNAAVTPPRSLLTEKLGAGGIAYNSDVTPLAATTSCESLPARFLETNQTNIANTNIEINIIALSDFFRFIFLSHNIFL